MTNNWPYNTIARYLTAGTATVDITDTGIRDTMGGTICARTVSAACLGCGIRVGKVTDREWFANETQPDVFGQALQELREDAQDHAEYCRAMPEPTN